MTHQVNHQGFAPRDASRLISVSWCANEVKYHTICQWIEDIFFFHVWFIAGGCGYIIEWSIWLVASTGCLKYVSTIDIDAYDPIHVSTSFMAEDHSGSGQRSWWLRVQAGQFPALEHQGRKVFLPGSSPRNHRTKWRFYWKNTETNHL